ncbi:biopolymer transporter ExbD [bacterium]|nr:biopolymer transporter ExbD [bacterium]HPF34201.1 biopolymer transporter ExbD [Candidatus Krumholzibacteria bacterium]HRX50022.1 biopolymer transporter ExbD [Candidatus Krumholzibacteria bacterium]
MNVYRFETKVDVVPIINVSLVIVLTLMIISPFLNDTEHEVELPEAAASQMDDTEKLEIIYTLDGHIFVGEDELTLDEVQPLLTPLFEASPDGVAIVKADKALLYGQVEELLAQVEAAKAPRIAIATGKKGEGGGAP